MPARGARGRRGSHSKITPPKAKRSAPAKAQSAKEKDNARRAAVREHFRKFDLNGDGKISHEEMTMVLSSIDPDIWTDAAIKTLLDAVDTNADGAILLDEFCDWMFGDQANHDIGEAVRSISGEGCAYVVLEVTDNMCAFLRTPTGAIIAALPYCRESGGFGPDLVHQAGRSFTAEAAFRNNKLPTNVPVMVLLDAGRPGGNYIPSAALALLSSSGFDLTDPESRMVKFVVAAPTFKTPRVCMIGSTCFATRYFLWELQRACVKHKFGGKVAFIDRVSLYVGQQTLYNTILSAAANAFNNTPVEQRNIGSGAVSEFVVRMCGTIKQHSISMTAAECIQPFRYTSREKFGQYIKFEPDQEDWVNAFPPGFGADSTATFAGHSSNMLVDSDSTVLFDLGSTPSAGRRVIDSRAAEASPEKVFLVTRCGLAHASMGPGATMLKAMCEDDGVTLWTEEKMLATFGKLPPSDSPNYESYLSACREGMDGVCVLDFSVDYWLNDFLVDLVCADYITLVLVVSPGDRYERYGHDDGSGFDVLDFVDINERLPSTAISAIVALPEDGASDEDWAHAGAFLWDLREVCDGVIAMPGDTTRAGGWGAKFLSTWLSITSTTLKHRFKGHLAIEPPLNIFVPYYGEGDSSSAAIDHSHVLEKDAKRSNVDQEGGPLFATYSVSCGMQAGYRLEALLDRISKAKIFGSCADGSLDELFLQAAGETSDDHGIGSLDEGVVRYATLAAGGKTLGALLTKCAEKLSAKAEAEKDDEWKNMVSGDVGLRTWVLDEFLKVSKALSKW